MSLGTVLRLGELGWSLVNHAAVVLLKPESRVLAPLLLPQEVLLPCGCFLTVQALPQEALVLLDQVFCQVFFSCEKKAAALIELPKCCGLCDFPSSKSHCHDCITSSFKTLVLFYVVCKQSSKAPNLDVHRGSDQDGF